MAVHGANALTGLMAELDQPSKGFGSKKDDETFDSALGMANFAISPSIAMPSQSIDGGRHESSSSVDASSAAGTLTLAGEGSRSTAQSRGQQPVTADASVGLSSPSAAAITTSFESIALGSSADGSQPSVSARGSNRSPLDDRSPSIAQLSGYAQASAQAQASAVDSGVSGSTSVGDPTTKSIRNIADTGLAGSVEITYRGQAASDAPLINAAASVEQPGDPKSTEIGPATESALAVDPSSADPLSSPRSAAAPAASSLSSELSEQFSTLGAGEGVYGTPAFAPPKIFRAATQTDPATSNPSESKAAGATVSAAPTSPVRASASYAAPAITPASDTSQPKSAAARSNLIAGQDQSASTAPASPTKTNVSGQQGSASNNPGQSVAAAAIQEAANGPTLAGLAAGNKRNLGPRTSSDAAGGRSYGGASAETSAMKAPAEAGGGAPQPSASVAPTLRMIATPTSETRIANLRIDLASGQSTQATVREHSGAVDVKIVTSSQQSAQAIGSELPALRRALDGAGVQLKAADVSHQGDSQGGHNEQQQENQSPFSQSDDGAIFAIEEVNQ